MDSDALSPKKVFLRKKKRHNHTFIKDRDLQIHIPTVEDIHFRHRNINFETNFISKSPLIVQEKEIKTAMAEAENAYDSMMQIRHQLKQAYEEFIHFYSINSSRK